MIAYTNIHKNTVKPIIKTLILTVSKSNLPWVIASAKSKNNKNLKIHSV